MKRAFTLIELLVVITIIVVLLALLAPAMDKAIYQAELAACASREKGMTTAGITYASNNRRLYPTRGDTWAGDAVTLSASWFPFDLRVPLRDYTSAAMFVDPLDGFIRLDEGSNAPATVLFSSYFMYFGWGVPSYQRMNRLGDRFAWTDANTQKSYRFNALVSDTDVVFNYWTGGGDRVSSHPDKDGVMALDRLQNQDNHWETQTTAGLPATYAVTYAWWIGKGQKVDRNYGLDDGSVARVNDVLQFDPRMAPLVNTNVTDYNNGRVSQELALPQ